ncbi:nephronectin isoform X1 [Coregonus clupeaformis]|uniref:nephronectin isoform X1 n=1 Tax=Coregonus clupeaformis TaxID=59861 RepID=UPI001BDFA9F4|nr:nephronectin isoform X1 [Coregonus clupeaformis]
MMVFAVVSAHPVRQRVLVITMRFIAFSMAFQPDRNRTVRDVSGRLGGPSGSVGLCTFGPSTACCLGWRNVNGVCQPVCKKPCRNGVCVAPDKCSCSVGYKGQQCDQDVNECGLPERPCSNSCMNTQGSYRCYCDPGYTLMTDGSTCTKDPECSSARCQFGCQIDRVGEERCLCAPGLHLAADNRTCEGGLPRQPHDVDECRRASDVCPPRRTCKNTFGSFVCACREGFVLGTLQDSVQCRDKDECLDSTHLCSRHSQCFNTAGSYTCQCLEDYSGDGHTCWPRRASHTKTSMYYQYKLSKRTRPIQQPQQTQL